MSGLMGCWDYDLILYQESCTEKVGSGRDLGAESALNNLACFSSEDLLKLTALAILPSYSLRSLGRFTHWKMVSFLEIYVSIPDVQVPHTQR